MKNKCFIYFDIILLTGVLMGIYMYIAFYLESDMVAHAMFAQKMFNCGEFPGNFIFYLLVKVLSGFSKIPFISKLALCFLLSIASAWRYQLAKRQIEKTYDVGLYQSAFWSLSLIFIFAIPFPQLLHSLTYFYFGSFTPNVWHNSTIIFLFPFAILLFNLSIKQLLEYNRNRNWWILLLVFLNIFIKPSYFFVWICVYPLFLFLSYHFKKEFWIAIVPAIIGVFLLVIEYSMIYFISPQVDGVKSGIIISPFSIYLSFYNHFRELPFTVIFSLLFPVLYVFLNWETAIKDKSVVFAALSTFVAIVIYLVFAETGPRANHGNFYWQVIPCSWLLFYVALINTLKMQHGYKRSVLIVVYFLHFIVGVVYIIRYMVFDNYI